MVCPRLNEEFKLHLKKKKKERPEKKIMFALTDCFGNLFSGFPSKRNLILVLKTFGMFSFHSMTEKFAFVYFFSCFFPLALKTASF